MKNLFLLLTAILAFQALTYGQQEAQTNDGKKVLLFEDNTWVYKDSVPLYGITPSLISSLENPKVSPKDKIITHAGYSLLYNEEYEQASWVAYELTKDETVSRCERTDKFIEDPLIKTKSANYYDYAGSGYDRGHLAPAADMGWSTLAMSESFYFSNMSPQDASFNRGIWKNLESLVRSWAVENQSLYIVTGPVLCSGLTTIGKNEVAVPKQFYKVILDYSEPDIKGIGFLLSNSSSHEPLQKYAVSIDSIESVIGIDLFPLLPDDQEALIEKTLILNAWSWKVSSTYNDDNKRIASASVQCNGTTKAGARCKNKTHNESGYCYLHESQSSNGSAKAESTTKPTQTTKSTSSYSNKQIQTGPRGGQYYINSSGKKVYVKKK